MQKSVQGVTSYSRTASVLSVAGVRTGIMDIQTGRHVVDWLYMKEIQDD